MNHNHEYDVFDDASYPAVVSEAEQNRQADEVTEALFGDEESAVQTGQLISQFVASYEQHKHERSLEDWLADEFRRYPTLWQDEAEIIGTAREIVLSIEANNRNKELLYAHLDAGKSQASWLARQIENGAKAAGVTQVGAYAARIDAVLEQSSAALEFIVRNGNGDINGNKNLHGFIAEAELANKFNIDAVTIGSNLKAKVIGSTALDSVDLKIVGSGEALIADIQVKSYADINSLINNIRGHNYQSGTVLMVHEDQVARLQQEFPDLVVTSSYEVDGVKVDMPSYEELKQQQIKAQDQDKLKQEIKKYEWNEANRINIAKQIGKQALIGACFAVGLQGVRIAGRRVWNTLNGRDNPPVREDLREFFQSSLKSGAQVGVQVAVTGAIVVAVKNGLIKALQNTPAGKLANIVYVGMENAKVLYKLAKGELDGVEALDAMGKVTCSALGGLAGGAVVGGILAGPLGVIVGTVIGSMAGSAVGEGIYSGAKKLAKPVARFLETAWEGTKEAAKAIGRVLNPLNIFA